MNLTTLLDQLNNGVFGSNEILFATLQNTDELNAPGGFSHICLEKDRDRGISMAVNYITR